MRRTTIAAIALSFLLTLSASAEQWYFGDLGIPRRVGVINAIHDFWWEPNLTAANDLASLGIRAIKIWPTEHYLSPGMEAIYRNPNFDVIVIRPLQNSPIVTEIGCDNKQYQYFRWENIDYGQVARDLYAQVGDLDKVIILTGWEADNQIKGLGCPQRIPTTAEVGSFVAMLDAREAGIRAAGEDNLDKNLRVYHAVEVNNVLVTQFRVIDEVIPQLYEKPTLVSYSHWSGTVTITESLDHIMSVLWPFVQERVFIGEIGRSETPWSTPYDYLYDGFSEAYDWGAELVFMWNYRDQFNCPKDRGMWIRRCDNSLSGSITPLWDLQAVYDE